MYLYDVVSMKIVCSKYKVSFIYCLYIVCSSFLHRRVYYSIFFKICQVISTYSVKIVVLYQHQHRLHKAMAGLHLHGVRGSAEALLLSY